MAQAPTLTNLSPTRHAVAASPTAPIRITFSQPIGAGRLRALSSVRGGQLSGAAATGSPALTLTPPQPFEPGEVVSVTVPGGVQAANGTPAAPQVYQFTVAAAGGSGAFRAAGAVPVGTDPAGVTAADLDNDGDLDLLTANGSYNPGSVSVRLNQGGGIFSGGSEVPVSGGFITEVRTTDVDGDGDLDFACLAGNAMSIRLNNGRGSFSGGSDPAVGLRPDNLEVADVDADGDPDLLVYCEGPRAVNVLLNNGSGAFSTSATVPVEGAAGSSAWYMTAGDVDNDGDVDFLAAYGNPQRVVSWLNNGSGSFAAGPASPTSGANYALRLADVDADGDLDLLTGSYLPSAVLVRLNNGSGTFAGTHDVPVTSYPQHLSTADVDADGDLDLLTANRTAGTLSLRLNNGNGTFSGNTDLLAGANAQYVTPADIDGDGDLDLLSVNGIGSNTVRLFLNRDQGSGPALAVTGLAPANNQLNVPRSSAVAVRFNQALSSLPAAATAGLKVSSPRTGRVAGSVTSTDSTLRLQPPTDFKPGEVLTVSVTNGARSSGNNTLTTPLVYRFTTAAAPAPGTFVGSGSLNGSTFAISVIAADMDGDGDLDLVSTNELGIGASGMVINRNNGNGTFSPTISQLGGTANAVRAADVDNDGDLDLVSSSGNGTTGNSGRLLVQLNNGTGSFTTGSSVPVGAVGGGALVGDVNGDGYCDALLINNSSSAAVVLNNGNGSFSLVTSLAAGLSVQQMALADVENDGDLDLLLLGSNALMLALNDGTGTFDTPTAVPASNGGKRLVTTDVDGDGDMDVLTNSGSAVRVYHNDGRGAFTFGSSVSVSNGGFGVVGLATGDIDGDGDQDLVATGGSTVVHVRLNDGRGSFSGSYNPFISNNMPGDLDLADLDNDGDLDLLVANYNVGGLSVRLNQLAPPTITSFSPSSGLVGTTVTVAGTDLTGATAVTLNGQAVLSYAVLSSTALTFSVPPGATSGPISITTPRGTATSTTSFTVLNPAPVLSSVTPATAVAGSGPLTLTLTGSSFVSSSTVHFQGNALPTTWLSATELSAVVPASALLLPGSFAVTVVSPAPGGGTSAAGTFVVTPAVPVITVFVPSTGAVGSTVSLSGRHLLGASQVAFNGVSAPNYSVDATGGSLTVEVPAGATTGPITVTTPGGSTTSSQSFTVSSTTAAQPARTDPLVEVYPNPAAATFSIRLTGPAASRPVTAVLLNSLGQTVARPTLQPDGRGVSATVPVHGLPAGLYTLRLPAATGTTTHRVMVQH